MLFGGIATFPLPVNLVMFSMSIRSFLWYISFLPIMERMRKEKKKGIFTYHTHIYIYLQNIGNKAGRMCVSLPYKSLSH